MMKDWRLVMSAIVIAIAMVGCADDGDDDGMMTTDGGPGRVDAGGGGTDAGGGGTDAGGGGTDAGPRDAGGGGIDAGPRDAGPADAGGGGDVSFADDVWPILRDNCAGGGCHGGGAGGLSMPDAVTAYANLVGVASSCMGRQRVNRGSSATSQLYLKLTDAPGCGLRMPRSRDPLSAADIATIAQWIDEDAPNN